MPPKNWDSLVTHAKTCPLNGKQYVYYDGDLDNFGIIFNNIHQVNCLIAGGQYYSAETLDASLKVGGMYFCKIVYSWMPNLLS